MLEFYILCLGCSDLFHFIYGNNLSYDVNSLDRLSNCNEPQPNISHSKIEKKKAKNGSEFGSSVQNKHLNVIEYCANLQSKRYKPKTSL